MRNAFLRVDELAKRLKLNPQTVRERIDRGELPAVRAGNRVRILQADLDRLIAEGEGAPAEHTRATAFKSEPPQRSPDHWARLDAALADSTAARANGDQGQLVTALRALATAANRLADTLASSETR